MGVPMHLEPWILLGAVVFLLGVWLTLVAARRWKRWVGRRAQRRGDASERRALRLLKRRGYTVLERHPTERMRLRVDGKARTFGVRADGLVQGPGRGGGLWVVEVKTGAKAGVSHRETRRQILEYALCFDVDGVLLVDPDHHSVVRIEWSSPAELSSLRGRPARSR